MGIFRFFHSTIRYQKENSSAMAVLRKKTGFALSSIRKALELNENDVTKAENWLVEQAKTLGWNTVMKLQGRKVVQGLVGVAVENKKVAMVEVNCETDFVSKNDKFKSLVELVAKTCLRQPVLTEGLQTHKIEFSSEDLGKLHGENNSLADEVALFVGSVQENAVLKRGFCYETTDDNIEVAVAVHPPCNDSRVLLGKYGAFISYKKNPDASETESSLSEIATDICTHIIGADPVKIGEYGKDEPSENGNDEHVLIHQDYLLNESVTIGQLLTDCGITILDFKRLQCGEFDIHDSSSQSEKCNEELHEVKT